MDVEGKKVTLVGAGITSLFLARLLRHLGATPFVTEYGKSKDCAGMIAMLNEEDIAYECGIHSKGALQDASLVIPSPGVATTIPFLIDAAKAGIPVMSELEFASRYSRSTLIAITGTNGKTTTTELIAHLMRTCGLDVALAGNNEHPFSSIVIQESQPEYLVLEISSYQLELVDQFRPKIAAVLNLSNDHLGRHSTMENYTAVKARILENQLHDDVAILNDDDPLVSAMAEAVQSRVLRFGADEQADAYLKDDAFVIDGNVVAQRSDSLLPGKHNTENILAALAVLSTFDIDSERIRDGLSTFKGVEHRIEKVADVDGVGYYNDSKSTNLDSLKVALESFEGGILLIAGGEGKGGDYSVLSELIKARVEHVIAIGADAELICTAWGRCAPSSVVKDMEAAVTKAHEIARPANTVLLSPACASFDSYANFEERGHDFKRCVHALSAREVGA